MIESRLGSEHQLVKVYHLLDWSKFSQLLSDGYKRKEKVAGVKPYEPVKIFRAMILQAWHSFSDPKMEAALKLRLEGSAD